MPRATGKDLQFVSSREKKYLDALAAGASLVERTGYSIKALQAKVISDRLHLARTVLRSAEDSLARPVPSFRTAVSRAYYSMYHATRALSYFAHGGDDHQDHSKLPASIPNDFPSRIHWENELKQARFERNRADYDPYPKADRRFESAANVLIERARDLLATVRRYLDGKGWKP